MIAPWPSAEPDRVGGNDAIVAALVILLSLPRGPVRERLRERYPH